MYCDHLFQEIDAKKAAGEQTEFEVICDFV